MDIVFDILKNVLNGNISVAYSNKEELNDITMYYLAKQKSGKSLNELDLDTINALLRIYNISYNNTSKDVLIVDDGVYDLLLELYKSYRKDFQVGSDIVRFKPEPKTLIRFLDRNPTNLINKINVPNDGIFIDSILYHDLYITNNDVSKSNSTDIDNSPISKRTHDTEHSYPELVGTLNKCKYVLDKDAIDRGVYDDSNVKILERDFFAKHIKEGIISPNEVYTIVCELKYDGVSVEADCNTEVISARSRGDTNLGKAIDMTPILKGYRFNNAKRMSSDIGIKFEAIITKDDLDKFRKSTNYSYANCRTAIIGIMASSDAYKYRDYITLVPLQTNNEIFESVLNSNRIEEIEFLNLLYSTHGTPNRYIVISGTYVELLYQINKFVKEMESIRDYMPYMYDGVVISYVDKGIRYKLGRSNFVNQYSMAIKFNPVKKYTVFRGYSYTVGKDGTITPMIHYDPVEFFGTVHTKSSGHSYARFKQLNLAKGDIISVEYVNDVIPYVDNVPDLIDNINNTNPKEVFEDTCYECGCKLEISPSGKTAKCTNPYCPGRRRSRLVNMFSKLNLLGFGEATINALGVDLTLRDICEIGRNKQFQVYGFGDGESLRLENELSKLFSDGIYDYELFGSIGFTGIGFRTWKSIFSVISMDEFIKCITSDIHSIYDKLISINGIGKSTIDTIINEYKYFDKDICYCIGSMNIKRSSKGSETLQIRATGFRDRELFSKLKKLGFDADDNSNVTKKTDILLIPYPGYNQGSKLKKISDHCKVIPVDEFRSTWIDKLSKER